MKRAKKVKWSSTDERLIIFCFGCNDEHAIPLKTHWTYTGDDFRPTISPSVNLMFNPKKGKPYVCHFFIKNGEIQYLEDSTHKYAGKTMNLPNKYRNNE